MLKGTYSSVGMLKGCMARKRLETPDLESVVTQHLPRNQVRPIAVDYKKSLKWWRAPASGQRLVILRSSAVNNNCNFYDPLHRKVTTARPESFLSDSVPKRQNHCIYRGTFPPACAIKLSPPLILTWPSEAKQR